MSDRPSVRAEAAKAAAARRAVHVIDREIERSRRALLATIRALTKKLRADLLALPKKQRAILRKLIVNAMREPR